MIRIRPFDYSDQDYETMVSINNTIWPNIPASVAHEKRNDSLRLPEHLFRRVLVERLETIDEPLRAVAIGTYGHMSWSFHPRKYYLNIQVLPRYRRRGIGSAIFDHIVAALEPREPIALEAGTREDKIEGQSFLENRGFTLASRLPTSELDPARFDARRFADVVDRVDASGIAIRPFAELASDPNHLRKLYDLECEAMEDIPWHDEFTPWSFDQFVKSYGDNPDLLPYGYLVALDGDQYVGMTQLWGSQATDTILYTGLTAVRRPYRRQGIATALKVRAASYAKTLVTSSGGPPVIHTDNEETNPMFQLNLRLGFREKPAWLIYRKPLDPEAVE